MHPEPWRMALREHVVVTLIFKSPCLASRLYVTVDLPSHVAMWADLQGVMACVCHVHARELGL